jgi:hypothetical protein
MRQAHAPLLMTIALVVFGLGCQGCGAAAPKAPDPPPAQAHKAPDPATREPYHVAPPPAYGNKVVLAKKTDR